MSRALNSNSSISILGAFRNSTVFGDFVNTINRDDVIRSDILAAGIIDKKSLTDVARINMFIIEKPYDYVKADNRTNKTLASSVVVVGIQENSAQRDITLYFKILPEYKPNVIPTYKCSFFNTTSSEWDESGCDEPVYNEVHDRYECSCHHLTSFALIWLPKSPDYLTSQDITSLIFQSISIISFIAVIIHSLTLRLLNSPMSLRAFDLLPLISSASTTLLFIFYIALGMTVYTRIPITSSTTTPCFTSASVLMFFVYFFLIFMFCVKISVGYFNYLRFVLLFPEPSRRKLLIMLIISFFISITLTSFAAGFNSNSSYNITQLQGNKLCWFNKDVIHYFMTIPVGIFLLLSLIMIILVGKHIIDHVRRSTSPHQSHIRMKRCVIVLLSSCVTQGVGWSFGPLILITNPTSQEVFGWLFVIFNGLEGLWCIFLYIIIRSQRMDEQIRIRSQKTLTKTTRSSSVNSKKEFAML